MVRKLIIMLLVFMTIFAFTACTDDYSDDYSELSEAEENALVAYISAVNFKKMSDDFETLLKGGTLARIEKNDSSLTTYTFMFINYDFTDGSKPYDVTGDLTIAFSGTPGSGSFTISSYTITASELKLTGESEELTITNVNIEGGFLDYKDDVTSLTVTTGQNPSLSAGNGTKFTITEGTLTINGVDLEISDILSFYYEES